MHSRSHGELLIIRRRRLVMRSLIFIAPWTLHRATFTTSKSRYMRFRWIRISDPPRALTRCWTRTWGAPRLRSRSRFASAVSANASWRRCRSSMDVYAERSARPSNRTRKNRVVCNSWHWRIFKELWTTSWVCLAGVWYAVANGSPRTRLRIQPVIDSAILNRTLPPDPDRLFTVTEDSTVDLNRGRDIPTAGEIAECSAAAFDRRIRIASTYKPCVHVK